MRDVSDGCDGGKNDNYANHASQRRENETLVHWALQLAAKLDLERAARHTLPGMRCAGPSR